MLNVYPGVPPAPATVIDPVELPKQATLTWFVTATVSASEGAVTITDAESVQPSESVTTTVYVPAIRLFIFGEF
jgi:hypothetical protein